VYLLFAGEAALTAFFQFRAAFSGGALKLFDIGALHAGSPRHASEPGNRVWRPEPPTSREHEAQSNLIGLKGRYRRSCDRGGRAGRADLQWGVSSRCRVAEPPASISQRINGAKQCVRAIASSVPARKLARRQHWNFEIRRSSQRDLCPLGRARTIDDLGTADAGNRADKLAQISLHGTDAAARSRC
jgi:hypothetical protein